MKYTHNNRKPQCSDHWSQGTRVELVSTSDSYTKTKPGDKCSVICVDAQGTLIIAWDNGTSLNIIPGEDIIRRL